MDQLKSLHPKRIVGWIFGCIFFATSLAWTQNQAPQKPAETGPDATQSNDTTHQIPPKEVDELFRSVDDILKFCSKETGLPIKHTVKRKLTSRDEVEEFLRKSMADDKDAER